MRKLLALLLLSSVAMPSAALADPNDSESRAERRATLIERVREAREQRSEQPRPERPVRIERAPSSSVFAGPRPADTDNMGRAERVERLERTRETSDERVERRRERPAPIGSQSPSGDSVTDWRLRERILQRQQAGTIVPREVPTGDLTAEQRRQRAGEILSDRLRERGEQREAERRDVTRRPPVFRDLGDRTSVDTFRHSWRRDDRYDWRRHRERNRHLFHLGWYYDPFGWGYRRWNIGWNIWPSYWSDRYWLRDPWQWRLPTVYGPYRWIRYYDDALLVDLRTGRVVDVIHDFFW